MFLRFAFGKFRTRFSSFASVHWRLSAIRGLKICRRRKITNVVFYKEIKGIPAILAIKNDESITMTEIRTLRLHNSLSGKKETFEPLIPGRVGMYVCGPTVYNDVHLGNCRTFVSFDVIYRYLLYAGYKVRYVRNITDVGHLLDDGEDRMMKGARLEQLEPMEIAHKYTVGFHDMMRIFNTLPPSIEPRATGHIPEQIEMVQEIIDNGYGYEANGSVYFDTIEEQPSQS